MDNKELIAKAASVIKIKKIKDYLIGDVGCALLTSKGNVYTGVSADIDSNTFCAEKNAIGSMLTAGEYKIKKIVAVWKDKKGDIHVISPCGNCRQLIKQVNSDNLETDVILDKNKIVKLKSLLPYHDSWKKVKL